MIISRAWYSLGCHEWGIVQRFFQEKEETCLLYQSKNRFLWLAYRYETTIFENVAAQRLSVSLHFLAGLVSDHLTDNAHLLSAARRLF